MAKRKSMVMTFRQRILKRMYPLFVWMVQKVAKETVLHNKDSVAPPVSFHSLSIKLTNGKTLSLDTLRGKKVLLVNTASDCGYTPQYAELQRLYGQWKDEVEIVAFPANDFKEQEQGGNEEIAAFCSVNYGVGFPIAEKSIVVKKADQHPVYQWLTNKGMNGWNDKAPSWNFAKYLVNENGILTHYFDPSVSPVSTEVIRSVQA